MAGFMSTTEAAAALGVTRRRVLALIEKGVLEAERIGRNYAVRTESVERRKENNPGPGNPSIRPGYSPRWRKDE